MAKNGFGKAGRGDCNMQLRWMKRNEKRLEKMNEKKMMRGKEGKNGNQRGV